MKALAFIITIAIIVMYLTGILILFLWIFDKIKNLKR